ncbi:MAG: polysaccharide pyruvyl transferase CsaB [Cyanobacteria bacterium QH_8_48_120]|nr:MAG: polysaccharide pyruvyl transferase CsaB [Cyanobacteria bacterium QH_1_48_107]PSO68210.1 MAG: polysaccharide pyruvyl transferase CsaB [Cyanobacteria bacterium QH_6_48_35]PSO69958.1 MAG: polysaccharide pyruvyl transferase CsaB [Cyanobacteria bacterium QS_1_48_34]PSO71337.1 MAG: polysaccharide pyruvyl transferase CsaB [Cyanobacteria bacterium QH_8_48_120]
MGQKRAILCGYYGEGNGGDEALLASVLQMLPKEITPIVLSGNPVPTRDRYSVESCDRRSVWSVLRALRASDFFIWGGGSLMQDTTSLRNPFYYGGLMALAQQRGLQTIAWAQGIGSLKYSPTRWVTRRALQGCTAVSVRDRASAELLDRWHIPTLVAPDPVWALQAKPVKGLWELPAPRVAVTLRAHPQLTSKRLSNLTNALINFQKATQTCILLVPFQPNRDEAIAHSVASQLPGSHRIISPEDPRELKGLFRGVEMAIGMRYHSLIMAAAEECHCFALSYDQKVSQLMEDLAVPGWEIEQLPDDPHLITKAWIEQYVNGEALTPTQIQSLRDRALMHQERLREALLH